MDDAGGRWVPVYFPGPISQPLLALRDWMRSAPVAAVGPFLGVVAADSMQAFRQGALSDVGVDVVVMPLLAVVIITAAARPNPLITGMLFALGALTVVGGAGVLVLALRGQDAPLVVASIRHLVVGAYAWAAVAAGTRRVQAARLMLRLQRA